MNRSALISAIENENFDLMVLLLENNIEVGDALLHAISEEYVEAVEELLQWEETNHKEGQPYVGYTYPVAVTYTACVMRSFSAELGGGGPFEVDLHRGHHAPYPGGPSEQLRDTQNPVGSRCHAANAARRQVSAPEPSFFLQRHVPLFTGIVALPATSA